MPINGNYEIVGRLAASLAIGLLIGLERGWERRELPEGRRAAGLRTFAIIGLLGGVTAQVSNGSSLMVGIVGAAVGLLAALGYWREREGDQDVSLTSAVAAVLTFCLGALAGEGRLVPASSAAVVVTLLLGFKPELHGFLRRIERAELLATIRLLLISIVLLPILPNRGFGPWQAFNPYETWWMVVLVAAISYVGYFAIKILGEKRGILMTGLCGGIVSSTAVTVSLSRQAGDDATGLDLLTAGVAVATAMMFPRMLVVAGFISVVLAARLLWPLIPAGLLALAGALLFAFRASRGRTGNTATIHEMANPLDLKTALQFGVFLAVIMILSRGASVSIGEGGLYALAALAGLVDVDAITLSSASMAGQGIITMQAGVGAPLIAAAVNTLLKPLIATVLGNPRMGARVAFAVALALAGGGAGYCLLARA